MHHYTHINGFILINDSGTLPNYLQHIRNNIKDLAVMQPFSYNNNLN